MSSQLFYSPSRVLFLENSHNKACGLLFIFVRVTMGNAHFQNNQIHISWEPTRPATVFFSYETTEGSTRKAVFVVGELLHRGFQLSQKRNPQRAYV